MGRKKVDAVVETSAPSEGAELPTVGDAHEGQPNGQPVNGQPKASPPVYKVGPIVTAKGECVTGCVWEKTFKTPDGREYRVHSINVEARYFNEKEGEWKPSNGFRPSQLSALEYILRKCGDFVFDFRDSQKRREEPKPEEEPIPI